MKNLFNLVAFLFLSMTANAQTWNFLEMNDADKALLEADVENWTHEVTGSEDRYNATAINGGEAIAISAGGTELAYAKGLKFTYNTGKTNKDKIRLNPNKATSGLQMNGADLVLTIPNVAAGTVIEMEVRSGKSNEERGFTVTNFTPDEGTSLVTTSKLTIKGKATANGDVSFMTTAGMNVISLKVVSSTETGMGNAVTAVPSAKKDDRIFTLSGVQVKSPARGIYIKGGKKIVVR